MRPGARTTLVGALLVVLLSSGCPEETQCIDSGYTCGLVFTWQVCQNLSAGGTCDSRYYLLDTGRGATTTRIACNACDCDQALPELSAYCSGLASVDGDGGDDASEDDGYGLDASLEDASGSDASAKDSGQRD
jgi:hypothetical protein